MGLFVSGWALPRCPLHFRLCRVIFYTSHYIHFATMLALVKLGGMRSMTIKDVPVTSTREFFDVLEDLRLKGVVFRGHRDARRYRISSTLSRHHKAPYNPRTSWQVDEMLRHFLGNLQLVNHSLPFTEDNRRARLEFGRHYGIPSPLIDFSYSPYVATFFAFNGVRPYDVDPSDQCAICCVNLHAVASVWSRTITKGFDGQIDGKKLADEHIRFRYEVDDLFQYD